jgi:hypothetical protein
VIKAGGTVVLDPTYVDGVVAMAPPPSAGALRSFLGMLSWCSGSLPHLAEEELPLRTLLQRVSARRPLDAKTQAAIAITPFWDETHQQALERCKELLRHAIERALVPADHEVVVMTDASSVAWAGFVATCPRAELDKPVESRSLQPVAFVGGTSPGRTRSAAGRCRSSRSRPRFRRSSARSACSSGSSRSTLWSTRRRWCAATA